MKHYISSFTCCFLLFSSFVFAQDTLSLSKTSLLQKIVAQNLQLKIAGKNYESAKADYQKAAAVFLPQLAVSYTGLTTTNPLMAFGSKLNQAQVTESDFNPPLLNHPGSIQNFATVFEIQQPLVRLDGLYARQAAKATMEAQRLQNERASELLTLDVLKVYLQLQLAYKALNVIQHARTSSQAHLRMVENYFKQGLLQKTDLLNVQVRVTEIENQLQYATSTIQNTSDYLGFVLNETTDGTVYKPSDPLENPIPVAAYPTTLPSTRKDFQALEKTTTAYRQLLSSSKMGFLPRLNAFGRYEMYAPHLLGSYANGYVLGAQLSWSLFDGYTTIGNSTKAKISFQKSELESLQYHKQSELEFHKAHRQLQDAESKVHLSQLAFAQSQEAYRIRQNRFTQGLEKTTDLLQAETQMIQKELEHLQAVFDYDYTQQYLQFLTK